MFGAVIDENKSPVFVPAMTEEVREVAGNVRGIEGVSGHDEFNTIDDDEVSLGGDEGVEVFEIDFPKLIN